MTRPGAIDGWKQAFLLALGFHIALFTICLFYPGIRHKKVKVPPVYHVQLFEPASKSPPAPPKIVAPVKPVPKKHAAAAVVKKKKPPRKRVKKVVKKEVKVARKPSRKAISLKPKKVQKKKAVKAHARKKVAASKPRQKRKVNEERQLSRRIRSIEEKVREKKEEQLLSDRLASLRKKVRTGSGSSGGAASRAAVGTAEGRASDNALRLYAGAIWTHVRKNWHFPEELLKRKDLEAIVSIRVDKNGHIMSRRFEKRSGYSAFDRSVLKAVSDSDPLPPLPARLRPGPLAIGIRFNPSRMSSP